MDGDTGKTVKATLKVVIDKGDAKRQVKEIERDLETLNEASQKRLYKGKYRDQLRKEQAEEISMRRSHTTRIRDVKKREHADDMSMRRSLSLRVRQQHKEDKELEDAKSRSLAVNVRNRRKMQRDAALEEQREEKQFEAAKRRSLQVNVLRGRREQREAEREARRQGHASSQAGIQTLQMLGAGGIAGRMGQYRAYGTALSAAGYGGAGSMLSGAAGPLAVAGAAGSKIYDLWKANQQQESNFYATGQQRASGVLKAFAPQTYSDIQLFRGVTRESDYADHLSKQHAIRYSNYQQQNQADYDWTKQSIPAKARAQAFSDYKVTGLPTANRNASAMGAFQYQQQVQLQPVLQAQAKAEKELQAARGSSAMATKRSTIAEQEYFKAADKAHKAAKSAETAGSGIGASVDANTAKTAGLNNASILYDDAKAKHAIWVQSLRDAKSAEGDVVGAANAARAAAVQVERVKLSNAEQQEAKSREGATSIGGMGVGGRMKGKLAFEMMQKNGIEFMSPDQIAAARAIAPEAVAKIEEKAGKEIIKNDPFYKNTGDPRYAKGVDEATAETDRQREKVAGMDVANESQTAQEYAKAFAPEFARTLMNAIKAATEIEINAMTVAGQKQAHHDVTR